VTLTTSTCLHVYPTSVDPSKRFTREPSIDHSKTLLGHIFRGCVSSTLHVHVLMRLTFITNMLNCFLHGYGCCIYVSDNVPLQLQMSDYWSKFLCTYGSERKKNKSIVFAAHTMNSKCLTFTNKHSTPCHMF
jgi:hypothetical protein